MQFPSPSHEPDVHAEAHEPQEEPPQLSLQPVQPPAHSVPQPVRQLDPQELEMKKKYLGPVRP